jgi:hypothetical protein
MARVGELIQEQVESGDLERETEFAADSSKAIIRQTSGGGGEPRPAQPPAQAVQEYRLIADTDPHVSEAVNTLVDFLVGAGFSIQPANIPGTDESQTDQDIAELKRLVEQSRFQTELSNWVWHALVDGTGFLELVVEDDMFKPKVLPTEDMEIQTDEFGNITEFIQQSASGEDITFEKHEIAILRFHRHPDEDFGHSIIEHVQEQADMLRDMEIDTARFVATKAYPPIVWKVGSEDRPWTQDQIDDWLQQMDDIEPESMLAVGHDVDHEVVGVTSTSSTAGAMRLEQTFEHLLRRIATGIGVPADLINVDAVSGQELQMGMQKFDRRIQRYRNIIREAVRYQVFPSIMENSTAAEFSSLPPDFQFGKHSSEEERLDAQMALNLVNNGMLTREAAAKRLGIDPETEMPSGGELDEHITRVNQLAGRGDDIQNPEGGRPTDTGGGQQSPGREVKTRENPDDDNSGDQDRPQQGATE